MFKNKNKNKYGFTLIETLVAISVLLLSITGPLSLAKQGVVSARIVKGQIISFYLAQEAMEHIRNTRDTNIILGQEWLSGLEDCISPNRCLIDITTDSISVCGAECEKLRMSTNGLYGYNVTWGEVDFRRVVYIDESVTNINNEVLVNIEMYWNQDRKNFIAKETMFNIR